MEVLCFKASDLLYFLFKLKNSGHQIVLILKEKNKNFKCSCIDIFIDSNKKDRYRKHSSNFIVSQNLLGKFYLIFESIKWLDP